MRRNQSCLVLLVAFGFGCSALNPPEDHLAPPLPAEDFCEVLTTATCRGALDCCSRPDGFTFEECAAVVGLTCTNNLSPIVSDPRSGYSAVEAGVQLNRLRALTERCDPSLNAIFNDPNELISLLTGSVEVGGLCNAIIPENFDEGRLDLPRFYSCRGAASCVPMASGEWRCQPAVGEGERCFGFGSCEAPLACIEVSDSRSECQARLGDDSACSADDQCESLDCGCAGGTCRCRPDDTVDQVYCNLLQP